MAKDEVRFRVSAKDQASKKFGTVAKAVKGLVAAYLGFRSVKMVMNEFKNVISLAGQQENAVVKLSQQLKNWNQLTEENINSLTGLAESLSLVTTFSKTQIIAGQAMLGSFALTAEQIKDATGRMLDLAIMTENTSGQMSDITVVAKLMGMAMGGQAGRLAVAGIKFSEYQSAIFNAAQGMEKFNILMEILDQNAKGLAEAVGSTLQGRLKQINNLFNEAKIKIGMAVVGSKAWVEILIAVSDEINNLNKWLTENREEMAEWAFTAAISVVNAVGFMSDSFRDLQIGIKEVQQWWKGLLVTWSYTQVGGKETREELQKQVEALMAEQGAIKETKEAWIEQLNLLEERIITAYFKVKEKIGETTGALGGADGLTPSLNTATEAWGNMDAILRLVTEKFLESNEALKKWKEELQDLGETIEIEVESWKEFFERFGGYVVSDFANTVSSALTDWIVGASRSFQDYVKDFVVGMTQMIAKAIIFRAIMTALGMPPIGFQQGGLAYQHGGYVRGPGGADKIPARLTAGEYVMRKEAVNRIGVENLEQMNRGGTYNNSVSVNINMQSSGDPSYDARLLAISLEEELANLDRQGKLRFLRG